MEGVEGAEGGRHIPQPSTVEVTSWPQRWWMKIWRRHMAFSLLLSEFACVFDWQCRACWVIVSSETPSTCCSVGVVSKTLVGGATKTGRPSAEYFGDFWQLLELRWRKEQEV
jgi:hypothetical protein